MTLAEKRVLLREYVAAEKAVLLGQSYTIKDRTLTRADLTSIQRGRSKLESEIQSLDGGGAMKVRRVLFRDS